MTNQSKHKLNSKTLTQLALLIALQVILTRFLSIQTPIVRIGFGFLPLAVMGIMYGPKIAFVGGIISDILGFFMFPTGTYFPGFTLTTGLTALIFGIFLYNKTYSIKHVIIASVVVCLGLNLCLDTYWLSILLGKGYLALLPTRIVKSLVMIPIQVAVISIVWDKFLNKIRGVLITR